MNKKLIIKIGVIAIVTIAILIWGISFLKSERLFRSDYEYVAIYKDIDGLQETDGVLLNGYKIGKVKSIEFLHDGSNTIEVKLSIDKDFRIPQGSVVTIKSVDIMGSKGVVLERANNQTYLNDGDTIQTKIESGLMDQLGQVLEPIKGNLANLLQSADSTVSGLSAVLNKETVSDIKNIIKNFSTTSNHLSKNASAIDSIMNNFKNLSKSLGKNSDKIDNIISNLDQLSKSMSEADVKTAVANLQNSLKELSKTLDQVNKGEGTIGKFMQNDSVYNNIQSATNQLNVILEELQEHPKKYINLSIFGGKEKKKKDESK